MLKCETMWVLNIHVRKMLVWVTIHLYKDLCMYMYLFPQGPERSAVPLGIGLTVAVLLIAGAIVALYLYMRSELLWICYLWTCERIQLMRVNFVDCHSIFFHRQLCLLLILISSTDNFLEWIIYNINTHFMLMICASSLIFIVKYIKIFHVK